jgi:hypothetical protein
VAATTTGDEEEANNEDSTADSKIGAKNIASSNNDGGDNEVCQSTSSGNNQQQLKIVPRVQVEMQYTSESTVIKMVKMLSQLRERHGFDGFTIESSLQEFALVVSFLR